MDILLDQKFVWNTRRILGLQIDIQKNFELETNQIQTWNIIYWKCRKVCYKTYWIALNTFLLLFKVNLRHFEEYTNSIHAGTNRGLEYNSTPVGPSTNIEKALDIMCNNSERNVKKLHPKIFADQKCSLNWNVATN